MTVVVPSWVLWTVGILVGVPLVVLTLGLAVIGGMVVYGFRGIWK